MDLKRLTNKAKDLVEKRGGTDSLKGDAGELKDIAKGKGSLGDKAKAAKEALSKPGAEQPGTGAPHGEPATEAPKSETEAGAKQRDA